MPDEPASSSLRSSSLSRWLVPLVAVVAVCATLVITRFVSPATARTVIDTSPAANAYTVNVVGTGHVTGSPDTLTLSMGISEHDAHAADCLSHSSEQTGTLIGALKQQGVADSDLQTSEVSVSAHYTEGGGTDGFDCGNTLTVTLHDLGKAGATIDAAAQAGGDAARISGMSFSISDTSALLAQARVAAVKNAHAQADELAQAAGSKLGAVHSITESTSGQPITYQPNGFADAAKIAVPIEAGKAGLDVQVTLVYELES